ncbi:MAG TPA: helix-turn-helix domain-containing protein [Chloroflexota bacterium]|jgi:excisionase family DNA binding protein
MNSLPRPAGGSSGDSEADAPRYYTVGQAARTLGVSPATIWRWIQTGKLAAYRIGPRAIRIRPEDLQATIQPVRPDSSGPSAGLKLVIPAPTPEEIARRQALVAKILRNRERRSIAPLTSADLVHMARAEAEARYSDQP